MDEDDNRIRLPRSLDAVGGAAAGAHTATYVITRMVAVGDRTVLGRCTTHRARNRRPFEAQTRKIFFAPALRASAQPPSTTKKGRPEAPRGQNPESGGPGGLESGIPESARGAMS